MGAALTPADLERVVCHFGIEKVISSLPQKAVCELLGLVCMKDLTHELGMPYGTYRSHMEAGKIPYPELRLHRRAYYRQEEAEAIRKSIIGNKASMDLTH